jgi:hypothetical protein
MKKMLKNRTSISLATAHATHKQNRKEKKRTCQKETKEDVHNVKKSYGYSNMKRGKKK